MLVLLFRVLAQLPLRWMHWLGARAGWLVYRFSSRYRQHLTDNLSRAGYAELLPQAIAEAGKSIFELPFLWCAQSSRVLARVRVEDWTVAQAAIDQGRGVVFLTPHLGAFEVIAQVIAARMPLTALYRPPRQAALRPLIEGARQRHNLVLAPASLRGVRTLLKTLKGGGAVGLLPDQVPQHGEGVWADFFGKPAYTMTLSAKLHQMTGAPIVVTYAERLPQGQGFLVRFATFDGALADDAAQQARTINAAMESLIARCPAQYFWSYNRYKVPPGALRSEA